jgi:hypothetical protein
MIKLEAGADGRTLLLTMSGMVSADDIDQAEENFPPLLADASICCVLLDWTALDGWEKGAKAVGTSFGMRHWATVRRVAVVGDARWDDETLRIADIYRAAEVMRFNPAHRAEAIAWLAATDRSAT